MGNSQDYVDLFKVSGGHTLKNRFENSQSSTNINSFDLDVTLPIVLNKKYFLVTGLTYSQYKLKLFPDLGTTNSNSFSLKSTTLKIGISTRNNENLSSTLVLLPKIASDYKDISYSDFYLGGIAFTKIRKNDNLKYIFGIYISEEAFGYFSTPLIGWYYLSNDKNFEMDIWLPINANVNYTKGAFSYGINYIGLGRSYNIQRIDKNEYVALSSIECTGYIQLNMRNKSVLFRTKLGYAKNDFKVYSKHNNTIFGFPTFNIGDNRSQLNPIIKGGVLIKVEAIYRFNLVNSDTKF